MAVHEVDVTIGKDGKVRIEIRGMEGMTCTEVTQELLDALGGEIISQEFTPEAYATVQETVDEEQHLKDQSE